MSDPVVASLVNQMAGSPKPPFRRRRLLERPRLIRALDRSRARVRMLVAAPGFGKTILAEQWAAGERRVAWVRARRRRPMSRCSRGEMAAAGAEIIPGCDRRLCERLNATADPTASSTCSIDLLSEDLARLAGGRLDRDRRLPAHPRVGDGRGVRRGDRPAVAAAGHDLDARSSELGVDAQHSLRRGARDRAERCSR